MAAFSAPTTETNHNTTSAVEGMAMMMMASLEHVHDDDEHDSSVDSNAMNDKYNQIRQCLLVNSHNNPSSPLSMINSSRHLWELRELALSRGGLVNDEIRQKVWPYLVGLRYHENDNVEPSWWTETAQLLEPNTTTTTDDNTNAVTVCSEMEDKERDLIRRDVGRSVLFHHHSSCASPQSVMGSFDTDSIKSHTEFSTATLAAVLTATISAPLPTTTTTNPETEKPHYYQGLHDIGGVLLHNLDYNEVTTTAILRRLCSSHLRDYVKANFADLQWFLDSVLLGVVEQCDPPVHEVLVLSGVPLVSTVLPWLLTWFTHSIHDEEGASRLVDAFMASHPLFPFYVSIALLVHPVLRTDILMAELDDPSSMHFAIQNLPSRIKSDWSSEESTATVGSYCGLYVRAQDLVETALSILEQIPPQSLLEMVDTPERAARMGLLTASSSFETTLPKNTLLSSSSELGTRATMASGVPALMATQQINGGAGAPWRKPFGPPARLVVPKPYNNNNNRPQRRKPSWLRALRNRVRAVVRACTDRVQNMLPENKGLFVFSVYFTCIVVYGIYDFVHFTYVYYNAMLFAMAH